MLSCFITEMSRIMSSRVSAAPCCRSISCLLVPRNDTGWPLIRIRPFLSANSRKPTRADTVWITVPAASFTDSTAV